MSRFSKAILILILTTLPLRGMAGVIAVFYEPQHHGAAQMTHVECDGCGHDAAHHEQSGDDSDAKDGHCSECSVSTPLVSESAHGIQYASSGTLPIQFLGRRLPARFPERLERPPLAL